LPPIDSFSPSCSCHVWFKEEGSGTAFAFSAADETAEDDLVLIKAGTMIGLPAKRITIQSRFEAYS